MADNIVRDPGKTVRDPGKTVRDHRGVTVDGKPVRHTTAPKLGGDKYKGGFEGLKGGKDPSGRGDPTLGATVRDHRPPPKTK